MLYYLIVACRKNGAAMKSSAPEAGPCSIKQSPFLFAVFAFRFFSEPHNLIYNLQQIILENSNIFAGKTSDSGIDSRITQLLRNPQEKRPSCLPQLP